jgi:glycosyltransferase involved in cell wall biosynthesis
MSKPFFSVIIPTYNRAHVLDRAINSVLSQTYKDYEIIIIDDGSDDHTQEVLRGYFLDDFEVHIIENSGVSKARNLAVEKARGQWLAFLDSDDEWLEQKLQKQFDYIQANPDVPLVHGEEIWIRNGTRVNPMKKHQKGGGNQFVASLHLCAISPSVAVMKKSVFDELGGFREDYPACEDYDLWLKLTSLHEVGFLADHLIKKYGGHDDQLSQKFKAMDYWRVKSIDWVLDNRELSEEQKLAAKEVLLNKAQILIEGYKKHDNLDNLPEIQAILNKYA